MGVLLLSYLFFSHTFDSSKIETLTFFIKYIGFLKAFENVGCDLTFKRLWLDQLRTTAGIRTHHQPPYEKSQPKFFKMFKHLYLMKNVTVCTINGSKEMGKCHMSNRFKNHIITDGRVCIYFISLLI